MRLTIAVLTYESHHANLIVQHLLGGHPGQVCGIVCSEAIVAGHSALGSLRRIARRAAPAFVLWKAAEVLTSRVLWAWSRLVGARPAVRSLRQIGAEHRVPVVGARDVNATDTLATVQSWHPDLLVSVYCNQRIGRGVRSAARLGGINVHGALLPHYRGLFPYFWALADGGGGGGAGVTVHWMDDDFDTGDVVLQEPVAVDPEDTVNSLAWKEARQGAVALERAIALIEEGRAPRLPQDHARARYCSWPTAADVRRLRARGRRFGSMRDVWRQLRRG